MKERRLPPGIAVLNNAIANSRSESGAHLLAIKTMAEQNNGREMEIKV